MLSAINAALPWIVGARPLFALPITLLSLAIPLAFLLAGEEEMKRDRESGAPSRQATAES